MCIFCDIIANKIPSKKIYEDDDFLAILDISQTTYGHSLIMPKKHYDNYLKMPKNEAGKLMELANELGNKIVDNLDANGCNILANCNQIAGQSVMHTHIHIIPRYDENDTINISFKENNYDLDEILQKINK